MVDLLDCNPKAGLMSDFPPSAVDGAFKKALDCFSFHGAAVSS